MAFQPGNVLRPFSDASDAGESVLLMGRPLCDLDTALPLDFDATIGCAALRGVVPRDVATGAPETQTNRGVFGQTLCAQVIAHGERPVTRQHVIQRRATELVGATAYLDGAGALRVRYDGLELLPRGGSE